MMTKQSEVFCDICELVSIFFIAHTQWTSIVSSLLVSTARRAVITWTNEQHEAFFRAVTTVVANPHSKPFLMALTVRESVQEARCAAENKRGGQIDVNVD